MYQKLNITQSYYKIKKIHIYLERKNTSKNVTGLATWTTGDELC